MLVKCVCSGCGHSYLADDQVSARLECPRCHVANEGSRDPADLPDLHQGADLETFAADRLFAPKALPPMYLTKERLSRGVVFGSLGGAVVGAALGAAFAAVSFVVPAVTGAIAGFATGGLARYGFGGRTVRQTRTRARCALALAILFAFAGFLGGAYAVERITGSRADPARADLDKGLEQLLRRRSRTRDEGEKMLLEQRIVAVEELLRRSSAEIEDYLWMQEAQVNQPLLAFAALRVTKGPLLKLGADAKPVHLEKPLNAGGFLIEMIIGFLAASRLVMPHRLRG